MLLLYLTCNEKISIAYCFFFISLRHLIIKRKRKKDWKLRVRCQIHCLTEAVQYLQNEKKLHYIHLWRSLLLQGGMNYFRLKSEGKKIL
jgi:hypothetical protein